MTAPDTRQSTAPKVFTLADPEPEYGNGAVFAVHYGDYHHRQEIWVASGANIGNLYPLGGEFGRPKVVEDPLNDFERANSREPWRQPPGTIPLHPVWSDVVARGPVVMLVPGQADTYDAGWKDGRQRLLEQVEELRDAEDVPPGRGWRASKETDHG